MVPVEQIWLSWLPGYAGSPKPLVKDSYSSITSPDHGQNAAPAAYPHLVTPQHLPGLPNTSSMVPVPGEEQKLPTHTKIGITVPSPNFGVRAADQPRDVLPRGELPALLRYAPFVPAHNTLCLCCDITLGWLISPSTYKTRPNRCK